jgi:hypothetical protein
VGGARYFNLENRRNPELERFKIRIKLRPRFRDSVGPRDSVRIRPKGRVMSSLEFAYFKGLG